MNDIITLINSVGFPIIACIYLAENNRKSTEAFYDLKIILTKVLDKLELEDNVNE